ncbi:16S rRNA (guanine(527)-N(7))-methyltransferase RsmG [Paenibacillus thermotolerans]|uniref:16S rRNA (guanine(527)-N(7))-methyltransferase RsmG n=1 Tax=Paenibacillus thermotolerans TaxID=3027807 RepID=UPI00236778A7|nr:MULTISPECIES: 16S rRNA (guanine(527)-N(7))-methyltransferase RsmG [unclassified Paenibacillus]
MSDIALTFVQLMAKRGIDVSPRQSEQFETYFRELVDWNERMNLTAITDREQVYVKHFYDSASLSFVVPLQEINTLADVGAGAGFPSIPLKILFPHLSVTIIDSLQKRIGFLTSLTKSLGLQDVHCVHGRAEDVGRDRAHRETYDMVTARAVARLSVLAEFCMPLVKVGGIFSAMKGADPQEELKEAQFAIRQLGGKVREEHSLELPEDGSKRHIIIIDKHKNTPKAYPRKAGTPLKSPLLQP